MSDSSVQDLHKELPEASTVRNWLATTYTLIDNGASTTTRFLNPAPTSHSAVSVSLKTLRSSPGPNYKKVHKTHLQPLLERFLAQLILPVNQPCR